MKYNQNDRCNLANMKPVRAAVLKVIIWKSSANITLIYFKILFPQQFRFIQKKSNIIGALRFVIVQQTLDKGQVIKCNELRIYFGLKYSVMTTRV